MMRKSNGGLVAVLATALAITAACGGGSSDPIGTAGAGQDSSGAGGGGQVTLEFAQWWEPELPDGALRGVMDDFEKKNPTIKVKLLSGPYASTKEQMVAGAASGTMSDVVGLDGAWVSDFVKQGSLADVSEQMKDAKFDESQLAGQVKIGDVAYMIPVVNFIYPMFVNTDLLAKAGVKAPPTNRTEFADAAAKLTALGNNTTGWILPLSPEAPNGIQNDVMSWVWASGGSMLSGGKPDLGNAGVKDAANYIKSLYDAKVIAPGSFTMKEQDKVEEFTNGRVGMMIDSPAHVTMIREKNPDLKFTLTAIPAADGYTGKRGIPYASWGIGISNSTAHKAEAFKLISYLMSSEVNSKLSTLANAFPGNTTSKPDFTGKDDLLKTAFKVYQDGKPTNEFTGLPVAEDLMRKFDEQYQLALEGDQSVDDALAKAQQAWAPSFR